MTEYSLFTDFLFSLQSPSSAGDKIIINCGGFIDHPHKGVNGGRRKLFFIFLSHALRSLLHAHFTRELADILEKNNKTCVYRLD